MGVRSPVAVLALALLAATAATAAAAAEFRSIADNAVLMYDAPSARATKLFVAAKFTPVEVVVSLDQWIKVRDQAGDLAWVEKKALSELRTVVVTVPVAELHASAADQAPVVFRAQQGVALELSEVAGSGWVKLRHRDGQTGYARVNQVWGL
jgi:SH3-like domain-containing protein